MDLIIPEMYSAVIMLVIFFYFFTLVYNDLFFKLQVDFLQNTIFMIVPDRCLNKIVSLQIDGGRCLVENQDPGPPQQGPAHQELNSSRATCTFDPSILE